MINLAQAVIDTNILVAVMVEDDRNHKEALEIWETIEKAHVPIVVLFELAFFLIKHDLSLEVLEKVVTDPKVAVVPNNLDDILYVTRRAKKVGYYDDVGDLMILSVARRLGIDVQTLDKNLHKLDV